MNIWLYRYTGENERLDKSSFLSQPIILSGSFRESVDRMSAECLIEYGDMHNINYIYIPEFSRYYYVESDTIERNDIHRLSLRTDVLMTFKTEINNCVGIVSRNEHVYNTNLIDDQLRFLGYKAINTYKFPQSLKNGESFIIAVNGE